MDYDKPRLFRRLVCGITHCPCQGCDTIRQDNAQARAMFNWPTKYPPLFYSSVNWEDYPYG